MRFLMIRRSKFQSGALPEFEMQLCSADIPDARFVQRASIISSGLGQLTPGHVQEWGSAPRCLAKRMCKPS